MYLKNKKAALELSISTIVVLVLGMTMLILGIVLVTNILRGATGAVELIDQSVKDKIRSTLLQDDDLRIQVYLPDNFAEIDKDDRSLVAFGIKNTIRVGTGGPQDFYYRVEAVDIETDCELTLEEADDFIRLGRERCSRPLRIRPGEEPKEVAIEIEPGEDAPLCSITYDITVYTGAACTDFYETDFFILRIAG